MITLITGGPGTGKTAWLVNQLVELQKTQKFRRLYVHGIRDLRLSNTRIFCRSDLCDICTSEAKPDDALYVEDWPTWKQTNALIVVDEVQRVWRSGNSASKIDSAVSALETHRHYGIDFWVITQSPGLVHANLRALIGRHVHLVAKWSGRTEYEWPECKSSVQSTADAVSRPYKLPSSVYKLYSSAEVHTKQNKRIPLSLYGTIGALLIAVVLVFVMVNRMQHRLHPDEVKTVAPAQTALAGGAGATVADSTINNDFPDFEPKIIGVPESAPAYKALVKVSALPIMMGCVQSKKTGECKCYTGQATIYPTTLLYCQETIANHRFNPYLIVSVQNSDLKTVIPQDSSSQ